MYRDFSDRSKNELLGLVSEVENEKLSNFTDWFGDRWYDFESWIGKLNIKNYLNNVNDYHKKVIDKNNATQSSINTIFRKVKLVDTSYKNTLSGKKSQLQQWQRYIDEMSQIVNPRNGKYSSSYISKSLKKIISNLRDDTIENIKTYFYNIWNNGEGALDVFAFLTGASDSANEVTVGSALGVLMDALVSGKLNDKSNSDDGEDIKTGLSYLSKINKCIEKYGKDDGAGLASSILGYLSTTVGVFNSKSTSGLDITSDILSLLKSSMKLENGIYEFCEKVLHPYEALKLDAKFGKSMSYLNIASNVADITDSFIDTYKAFVDPESSGYDKAAEAIKAITPILNLGKDVYIASQAKTKALRFVSSADGSSKVVNQILATDQTLKYTTSKAVTQKIKNVGDGVAIVNAFLSSLSCAVKEYGEAYADGEFDLNDRCAVAINFGLGGLSPLISYVTLGLIDFDAETVADDLMSDVDEFVSGDSWAAQYIRNQDKNVVLRAGVTVGASAYILGENAVEGVVDAAENIATGVVDVAENIATGVANCAEAVADDLMSDVDEFVSGDSWAAQYIRNQDKNVVLRAGVTVGASAYILGENAVEGVVDVAENIATGVVNGAEAVGSWISAGWNAVTNWF